MWPRTDEERKRKRNCGFVKYYKYEAAYLAKENLNEKSLLGMSMKINWGKGIS
jgi:RNA recognition motif-containing protein